MSPLAKMLSHSSEFCRSQSQNRKAPGPWVGGGTGRAYRRSLACSRRRLAAGHGRAPRVLDVDVAAQAAVAASDLEAS